MSVAGAISSSFQSNNNDGTKIKKKCLIFAPDQEGITTLKQLAQPYYDDDDIITVTSIQEGKAVFTNNILTSSQQLHDAASTATSSLSLSESNSTTITTTIDLVIVKAGKHPSNLGIDLLRHAKQQSPSTFALMYSHAVSNSPMMRMQTFHTNCVNMISHVPDHCRTAIQHVSQEGVSCGSTCSTKDDGRFTCPYCTKGKLTLGQLCVHLPLFHANEDRMTLRRSGSQHQQQQQRLTCPVCNVHRYHEGDLEHHVFYNHNSSSSGSSNTTTTTRSHHHRTAPRLYSFALCVIQRRTDHKFLLVQERCNVGYWLPGGGLDGNEDPMMAAIRETKEEAGIDVYLTGVLRLEINNSEANADYVRMRYIFYGMPVNEDQAPKTLPDHESVGACWVTAEEVEGHDLKLRGAEPREWFRYIMNGGPVYPMSLVAQEGAPVELPKT